MNAPRRGPTAVTAAGASIAGRQERVTHPADVAALVALLVGGVRRPADPEAWERVVALAARECCGPLLWSRARTELTRAHAGAAADLRAHAVAQSLRLRRRLERAAEAGAVLSHAAVPFALWKGMATSTIAYDDAYLRPSGDVDLWLPTEARASAQAALVAAGWRLVEGRAPWEQAFERDFGDERERLELHSYLQGDLLAHLPSWPVEVRSLALDGVTLPVVAGASLALSLAVHHARHRTAPLLWAADLRAVLRGVARDELLDLARRTRTTGYVRHAERVVGALERVAAADIDADATLLRREAAMLGFRGDGARDNGHPAWRDLAAAATPGDRLAVAVAWAAPPRVRADGGLLRGSMRRLARRLPVARASQDETGRQAPDAPVRSLPVDRDELETMLRAVVEQGGVMWLRARGRSMHPTIPDGALVRLRRVADGPLPTGSVVLARLDDGSWAMHRVVREGASGVVLHGDATVVPDPLVPRERVLAAVDAVTDPASGALRTLGVRAPWTFARLVRPVRRLWWRARARRIDVARRRQREIACPT